MTKTIGCGIVIIGLAVLLGFMGVGQYNGLVGSEQSVSAAWAQVENTYQRRADLIPNLVATVKGSADFEQETLQGVVDARSRVGQVSGQATQEILEQPREVRPVPAGAGRPFVGAVAAAGGGGEVSGAQVDGRFQ